MTDLVALPERLRAIVKIYDLPASACEKVSAAADEIERLLRRAATWDDDYNRLVKSDAAAIAEANARADTAEQRLAEAREALNRILDETRYCPNSYAAAAYRIALATLATLAKIGETNDRG